MVRFVPRAHSLKLSPSKNEGERVSHGTRTTKLLSNESLRLCFCVFALKRRGDKASGAGRFDQSLVIEKSEPTVNCQPR